MLLKIGFPRKAKKLYDEIHVDIQGVKVIDPTAFISVKYANQGTGDTSREELLPVTDIEKYADEEVEEVQEAEEIKALPETINHSPLPIKHDEPTQSASN